MIKILKFLFKAADDFVHSMGWLWEDVFFFFPKIYRLSTEIYNLATQNVIYIVLGLIILAVGWYIYLHKE